MTAKSKPPVSSPQKDAFSSIAMWQFLSFILILSFVWVNEVLDLPHVIFRVPPSPFNFFRACILSAGVIVGGVVTVGHTYEKQKSLIRRLLRSCLFCHRVKTEKGEWIHVEDYFLQNFPVAVDRDPCPDCQAMLDSVKERTP